MFAAAAPQSRVGSTGLGVAILPVWSRWNRLSRQVVKVSFSGDVQKPSGHSCPWSATRLSCLLANESTCSVSRYVWLLPLSYPDSELCALVYLAFLLLNPLFIQLWWHSLQRTVKSIGPVSPFFLTPLDWPDSGVWSCGCHQVQQQYLNPYSSVQPL